MKTSNDDRAGIDSLWGAITSLHQALSQGECFRPRQALHGADLLVMRLSEQSDDVSDEFVIRIALRVYTAVACRAGVGLRAIRDSYFTSNQAIVRCDALRFTVLDQVLSQDIDRESRKALAA